MYRRSFVIAIRCILRLLAKSYITPFIATLRIFLHACDINAGPLSYSDYTLIQTRDQTCRVKNDVESFRQRLYYLQMYRTSR